MIWLLISFSFFVITWVLPFADPYEENMIIQIAKTLSLGLGLVTLGVWLGVLCG